jgi:hypothetical protein
MAKQSRAPTRRRSTATAKSKRAAKPKGAAKPEDAVKVPVQRTYTPELLANGRYRYEQTAEQVATIAADFGIHPGSLRRLGQRLGWVRYDMAPRALPAAARLMAEAARIETLSRPPDGETPAAATEDIAGFDVTVIARLERQVMEELATVEAMRAQLKGLPRRPRDAETTARTLTALTDTLQKLQRLRCAVPQTGPNHDDISDMPADLDAFREALAQRIEKFLASRTDADAFADPVAARTADIE